MTERIVIVIPVRNEESILRQNLAKLREFLRESGLAAYVTTIIADNASTDASGTIAREAADESGGKVLYYFVPQPGKGSAIKHTWRHFNDFDIYAFMDADLATDLGALSAVLNVAAETDGIAMGSRFVKNSRTRRTVNRQIFSLGYRILFTLLFGTRIRDPQCGFKAISVAVRDCVLPDVESDDFFFDTELVIRAAYAGFKVTEVPVVWNESPTTTVRFVRDVPMFLRGLARLKRAEWSGRIKRKSCGV